MTNGSLHYDVVVLGAGVAGLTAAARLAEGGARVCVLAKGVGSTHLAPGTVDVLGYDAGERVESPARTLPDFVSRHPAHPYALLGVDSIAPALEWFSAAVERGPKAGYRYVGSLERNMLLPTAIGAARPSALVPETMGGGDLGEPAPVCVVGLRVLRDFHASLCAANLSRAGHRARAQELDVDVGRAEANSLGIARRFDDASFRSTFAARLAPELMAGERLALPAVLGLRDPHGVLTDLRQRLGRPVFEIPTLPPSVPGMRVYDVLVKALRAAGGRPVMGSEVTSAAREGTRVTAVRAHTSGHDHVYEPRWVVLATGGVASGALTLGSDWVARETALGLPLSGMPAEGEPRFNPDYFSDQPLHRVGVAVDSSLIAEGTENVLVAGAALPGAAPWREGSGEGISLTSGFAAAKTVLEREGAVATA
jgi:glycerol-3-phosphate dehydrogenase subunit B